LYVLLMDDDERVLVENLASHAVDGYFYRDETDYNGWFRILTAELAEKSATPFYDKLKQYVRMAKDSWHTPAMPVVIRSKAARGWGFLRFCRREHAARRPVRFGADAGFTAAPDRGDCRVAKAGGQSLWRAQDLLCHQWHFHLQQGDLPDLAGTG
jgi:hypothetical protein